MMLMDIFIWGLWNWRDSVEVRACSALVHVPVRSADPYIGSTDMERMSHSRTYVLEPVTAHGHHACCLLT